MKAKQETIKVGSFVLGKPGVFYSDAMAVGRVFAVKTDSDGKRLLGVKINDAPRGWRGGDVVWVPEATVEEVRD